MNIIKAIVIKTNVTFSTDYWGLYATSGNSEFRFSEKQLSGVTNAYHPEFITKNGIPDIIKTCDLLESGGVVQSTDITIRIKNTNQFDKFLESNGISLLKSTVEFYTYVGTDADSDSVIGRCDGVRTIESIEYTETELILKVKMSLTKQRNKRLSSTLDSANYPYIPESNADKLIPVLFGSSDPINGRYFKILQSTARNDVLRHLDLITYDPDATYNPYSYKFPAIQDSTNSRGVVLLLGYALDADDIALDVTTNNPTWFDGLFLFCIQGSSGITNTAREIRLNQILGDTMPDTRLYAVFGLRDYLSELPQGNATFNDTDQSYFELHRVDINYLTSYYQILGFYDSLTEESQSINYDLYGKINDTIEKLMSSSIEYNTVGNILNINPRIFNNTELTSLLNYDCYPASRIDKMVREDFDAIGHTGYDVLLPGSSPAAGLNSPVSSNADLSSVDVTGSYFNAIDRQTGSGHRWLNTFNGITQSPNLGEIELGFKIAFPILPEDYKFTKCYLGINHKVTTSESSTIGVVMSSRIYLQKTEDVDVGGGSTIVNVDNIPDFYYLTDPDTGNYNFFYEVPDIDGGEWNVRGHKLFEIDATNIKDLQNIGWVGLIFSFFGFGPAVASYNIESIFEEACFIFEREQDISGELLV